MNNLPTLIQTLSLPHARVQVGPLNNDIYVASNISRASLLSRLAPLTPRGRESGYARLHQLLGPTL